MADVDYKNRQVGQSHFVPEGERLTEPDDQLTTRVKGVNKSQFKIDTMPKLYPQRPGPSSSVGPVKSNKAANSRAHRLYQNCSLGNSARAEKPAKSLQSGGAQVTFWAGLRVEGGLSPFGIGCDDLTRWNDLIHNGGLFEKIGNGLK